MWIATTHITASVICRREVTKNGLLNTQQSRMEKSNHLESLQLNHGSIDSKQYSTVNFINLTVPSITIMFNVYTHYQCYENT